MLSALWLVAVAPGQSVADDGRVFRSIVFPGMGQLGDGQTVKGLAFMASEVVLLSFTFSELSHSQAYAQETYALKVQYELAGSYEEKKRMGTNWTNSYNNFNDAQTRLMIFGGLSLACWALNIADALLFAPAETEDETSLVRSVYQNLAFNGDLSKLNVSYTLSF